MIGDLIAGQAIDAAPGSGSEKPAVVEVESLNCRARAVVTGAGRNSVELEGLTVEADGKLTVDSGGVIKALEPAAGQLREIERQSDGTRVIRTPEPRKYDGEIEYSEVTLEEGEREGKPVTRATLHRFRRNDDGEGGTVPFPVTRKDMARTVNDLERALCPDSFNPGAKAD